MRNPVEDLIDRQQTELMAIRRRVRLLQTFITEFNAAKRGRQYKIWNDLQWVMLLDARDMMFVMLSDWANSQSMDKGGLFTKLRSTHSPKKFARKRKGTFGDDVAAHAALFAKRFPAAKDQAGIADIKALAVDFGAAMAPIHDHRHQNIAHVRERIMQGEPRVAMLRVDDAEKAIAYADDLFNDLRMLVGGAYFVTKDPLSRASPQAFAEELVDSLLLHPMLAPRAVGRRKAVYDELHRRHEENGSTGAFNTHPLGGWPGGE